MAALSFILRRMDVLDLMAEYVFGTTLPKFKSFVLVKRLSIFLRMVRSLLKFVLAA